MKIMVLAGGPDREREVSLMSGAEITRALREAGHDVEQRDMGPGDLAALDFFAKWRGDVVFPIFHGRWGEGGPAQKILDERGLAYVGCREDSARLCFDKTKTKEALLQAGLPTPVFELLHANQTPTLTPPVVVKPNDDGSSIDLAICHDQAALNTAWDELSSRNSSLLVEQLIHGKELTVSVIADENGHPTALPSIHIIPATDFYDYQAKYFRDDTQYLFDAVSPALEEQLRDIAAQSFETLGCQHMARVDMFLDPQEHPWVIEVNTLPGCTSHSLLPMAARQSGLEMPALVDRLVKLAAAEA